MLRAERLDDRICPTATLSKGVLTITGTGVNDYVRVDYSFASGGTIVVNEAYGHAGAAPVQLPTSSFDASSVRWIVFNGNAGDDTFTNRSAPWRVVAHGGDGNDTLTGFNVGDDLYGDAGDDTLNGGIGDDRLYGGDGNDVIYGGYSDDAIYGGLGDDQIVGGAGLDSMYGEGGNDAFDGAPDGVTDRVSGGSGYDVVYGAVPEGFDPLDEVAGVELWLL